MKLLKKLDENKLILSLENSIKAKLSVLNPTTCKFSSEIVLFAINCVEHILTKKKSGSIKLQVVINCLLPYFQNDVNLIIKFVDIYLPQIPKSNIFRRNRDRIYNFFLRLVSKSPIN